MPANDRLAQLFQIALDQPAELRAEYLNRECAGDPALLAELQSLLENDANADSTGFWKASALEVEARNSALAGDPRVGHNIGPYRILHAISSGGMGTVYQAVRDDDTYQKHVAIKVIKRGMDTDFIVHRFRTERQILASLEHPNIARLLDGGATDDGLPYLVMEFVEGQPIDQYVQERQLSITERLQLFRTVCSAVQYAHQNLVVHRDLKPSNILVTREGQPKLLDFGIAKLVSQDSAVDQTLTMMRFLTPEYASPEQIRGEPITTVSDIYSLGVLLYRLLTGQRPYRVKSGSADELATAICTEEPDRPSTAVARTELKNEADSEGVRIQRRLRGDLDNIVLMALRKEPERRYASVEQFSEDIRRELEGLPVIAHRDSLGYRAGKFVRRNRMGVAAAALILLSLVAGIVGTAWQAHVARVERARAERRFAEVRKLANTFLFEIHDSIDGIPGTLAARQLILKRALEYLDDLAREAGNDQSLKSELADAYERVGTLTWDVSARLEIHKKGLALTESMVRAEPANAKYKEQLAESYNAMGDSLKDRNDSRGAMDYYRRSQQVMEELAAANPGNQDYEFLVTEASERIGLIWERMGQPDRAMESHLRGQKLLERMLAAKPADVDRRRSLMNNHLFLARAQVDKGDYRGALENWRTARETAEQLIAADPTNVIFRRDMWISDSRIGNLLLRQGNLLGACSRYESALVRIEQLSSADPGDKGHRRGLATTYVAYADTLAELNELSAARRNYNKAIEISSALLAADPDKGETRADLALMYTHLGAVEIKEHDWTAASESLNKGRNFYEDSSKLDPDDVAAARGRADLYARLGDLHAELNHPVEARDFYRRSLEIWRSQRERNSLQAADSDKPAEMERAIAKLVR